MEKKTAAYCPRHHLLGGAERQAAMKNPMLV
jgi:hypothetical protein